jgi:hypothetical protein
MAKQKKTIVSVTYSYVGTEKEFEMFLQTLVRDYLCVDIVHSLPEETSVQTVESGAA